MTCNLVTSITASVIMNITFKESTCIKMNKPTETFRKILKYYEITVFHKSKTVPNSKITVQRRFPIVYATSRLIVAVAMIHLIRQLYLCILDGRENGSSIELQVSELFLYILGFSMVPYYDIGVFMSEILPNLEKSMIVCDNIWNKIGYGNQQAKILMKEMSFKIWRLFFHNW